MVVERYSFARHLEATLSNKYNYGIHTDLSREELFFLIMLDEASKQIGVDDLVGAASVLAGQPLIPTRGKFAGAVRGTSLASVVSRTMLPIDLKHRILPTVTSFSSLFSLKIKLTRNIGAFVGRAIPGVGRVILGTDASMIIYRSSIVYNGLVVSEDRL